jgi:hypothetical protein
VTAPLCSDQSVITLLNAFNSQNICGADERFVSPPTRPLASRGGRGPGTEMGMGNRLRVRSKNRRGGTDLAHACIVRSGSAAASTASCRFGFGQSHGNRTGDGSQPRLSCRKARSRGAHTAQQPEPPSAHSLPTRPPSTGAAAEIVLSLRRTETTGKGAVPRPHHVCWLVCRGDSTLDPTRASPSADPLVAP